MPSQGPYVLASLCLPDGEHIASPHEHIATSRARTGAVGVVWKDNQKNAHWDDGDNRLLSLRPRKSGVGDEATLLLEVFCESWFFGTQFLGSCVIDLEDFRLGSIKVRTI
jgi:hypothetical protein